MEGGGGRGKEVKGQVKSRNHYTPEGRGGGMMFEDSLPPPQRQSEELSGGTSRTGRTRFPGSDMRLLAVLTTGFTLKLGHLLFTVGLSLQVKVAGGVLKGSARPRVLGCQVGGVGSWSRRAAGCLFMSSR